MHYVQNARKSTSDETRTRGGTVQEWFCLECVNAITGGEPSLPCKRTHGTSTSSGGSQYEGCYICSSDGVYLARLSELAVEIRAAVLASQEEEMQAADG